MRIEKDEGGITPANTPERRGSLRGRQVERSSEKSRVVPTPSPPPGWKLAEKKGTFIFPDAFKEALRNNTLPKGCITVQGNLDLSCWEEDISLPDNLIIVGDLSLSEIPNLRATPEYLLVKGTADISSNTGLLAVNKHLTVEGDLLCEECPKLTFIKEKIFVAGDWNLSGCIYLQKLPMEVYLGGDLDLTRCSSLSNLPQWVANLPSRKDGEKHFVTLTGTRLPLLQNTAAVEFIKEPL